MAGYGLYSMEHPHHRFWANDPFKGFPPPPGALSGGLNFYPSDEAAINAGLMERPPARSCIDDVQFFSTNEVAINWNAPLVWVAAFLKEYSGQ